MKKTLLLLAAAASFGTAQAQKMGDVFIYGGIGYNQVKQKFEVGGNNADVSNYRLFTATPGIGYQFSKNFGAGVQLDMAAGKTTLPSGSFIGLGESEIDTSSTAIGLFVRYTRNLSPLFFVYGQLNGNYLRTNSIYREDGVKQFEIEGNGFGVSVMPAIGINLSRSISVIGSFGTIGYKRLVENEADNSNSGDLITNRINTTFGNDFRLTVQWNLGQGRMRTRREPMTETRNMDRYRDDSNDNDREEAAPRRRRGRMDDRRMDRDDN